MMGSISRRYARALIQLGKEQNLLEQLGQEMDQLGLLIQQDDSWVHVLADDLLSQEGRMAGLEAIANKLGLCLELKNFLLLIIKKERFSFIKGIIREFGRYRDEILGIVRVLVCEASMPSQEVIQKVESFLSKRLNKKVIATGEARPGMIGGITLKVGYTIYDGSIQRELERMKASLMQS